MEFLVYKEANTYIGVCLTFDIVEEGDDPNKLMQSIQEAARLHLKVVCEKNLPDELLNRRAEEKYWKIYFDAMNQLQKPVISPYQFLTSSLVFFRTNAEGPEQLVIQRRNQISQGIWFCVFSRESRFT